MPGKRSPERLLARHSRAVLRGFVKSTIDSGACFTSTANRVSYESTGSGVCDILYLNDPWAASATLPSSGDRGDRDRKRLGDQVTKPLEEAESNRGDVDVDSGSLSGLQQAYNAALCLIEQQNNTIAILLARFECALPPCMPLLDASLATSWSGDSYITDKELLNVKDEVRTLAASLPSAVESALAKRLLDIVCSNRFACLEELVKDVASVAEATIQSVRGDLSSLSNQCASVLCHDSEEAKSSKMRKSHRCCRI